MNNQEFNPVYDNGAASRLEFSPAEDEKPRREEGPQKKEFFADSKTDAAKEFSGKNQDSPDTSGSQPHHSAQKRLLQILLALTGTAAVVMVSGVYRNNTPPPSGEPAAVTTESTAVATEMPSASAEPEMTDFAKTLTEEDRQWYRENMGLTDAQLNAMTEEELTQEINAWINSSSSANDDSVSPLSEDEKEFFIHSFGYTEDELSNLTEDELRELHQSYRDNFDDGTWSGINKLVTIVVESSDNSSFDYSLYTGCETVDDLFNDLDFYNTYAIISSFQNGTELEGDLSQYPVNDGDYIVIKVQNQ